MPTNKQKKSQIIGNNISEIDEAGKKSHKDKFYPNAVHCMLALYRKKYEEHLKGQCELDADIWADIAQEMQESYFAFDAHEIKSKLIELRQQYFALQTPQDIKLFEYYEQLHEIYQQTMTSELKQTFADDELFATKMERLEPDAVMDDAMQNETQSMWIKLEEKEECEGDDEGKVATKRLKTDFEETPANSDAEMTLRAFNIEQERRHQAQMQVFNKILQEQQTNKHLLEQLLKRF